MIVVRITWDNEPDRIVGPFGKVNEAITWIGQWRETMFQNAPDVIAKLSTIVLSDPVEGMSWATAPSNLKPVR